MLVCATACHDPPCPAFHSIQCLNKVNYLSLNFNLFGIFVFTLKVENSCRKMEQLNLSQKMSLFSAFGVLVLAGRDSASCNFLWTLCTHFIWHCNVSLPMSIEIIWNTKKKNCSSIFDFDLMKSILRNWGPNILILTGKCHMTVFRMVKAAL